jgi:RNA polymerase sigma-70 factor (ECF subfamily)
MVRTPASLLDRLRGPHDPQAWARFVELYTPLLFSWTRRLGLTDADGADLVQDVFLILLHKLPAFEYDRDRRFRGWLWTLTRNRWATLRRARGPVAPGGPDSLPEPAAPDGALEMEEAEYRGYLVGRALSLLRADFQPTTWQAFWECVACDRPAAEVAAELGLSLEAIYAARSRILRRLREELRGLLD